MMADVEPIPWQMLLPMFNSVADVGTTCWLIISQILDIVDISNTLYMLNNIWQYHLPQYPILANYNN